ncbi:hypothetical protein [Vreelandella populi]|uniref:Uncharacterized protein n=1 Tax=Vreelandella populi TaxID=2498858 RepID=A0A3S0YEM9_9GAMM|nr:hypothetical protein [Halomonas populi]RUR48826.1 hypothetical protein ELY37_02960 [Halomonas populi]
MVDTLNLRELINDCGGARLVAKRFGCTYQNVHKMIQRGCLPDCDRREKRRAEILAGMQKQGRLSPDEIRAIVKG